MSGVTHSLALRRRRDIIKRTIQSHGINAPTGTRHSEIILKYAEALRERKLCLSNVSFSNSGKNAGLSFKMDPIGHNFVQDHVIEDVGGMLPWFRKGKSKGLLDFANFKHGDDKVAFLCSIYMAALAALEEQMLGLHGVSMIPAEFRGCSNGASVRLTMWDRLVADDPYEISDQDAYNLLQGTTCFLHIQVSHHSMVLPRTMRPSPNFSHECLIEKGVKYMFADFRHDIRHIAIRNASVMALAFFSGLRRGHASISLIGEDHRKIIFSFLVRMFETSYEALMPAYH
jgi:hypothetical protein